MEKKTIKKIVAGALAFVCACTAGIVGLFHAAPETDGVDHNNQLSFGSFFGSGLSIVAASAETVDATSEGKTTLTATVTPAELAPYIKVDWAIAWQNAESEWATGKTVTDYVTITPTSDGALTAEVACKAAFGEKVVVNVSARNDVALSASCVCDYQVRYEELAIAVYHENTTSKKQEVVVPDVNGQNGRIDLTAADILNGARIEFMEGRGTGTVEFDEYYVRLSYTLSQTFQEKLQAHGFSFTKTEYSAALPYTTNVLGGDLLSSTVSQQIVKAKNVARGTSTASLAEAEITAYMNYREALEETVASGEKLMVLTFIVLDYDFNELSRFGADLYAEAGGLPSLVDTVSVTQTNILF